MNSSCKKQSGFSLVEVALALGLMSFCLLALMGLLPMGLNTIHDSTEETLAVNAASAILPDIRGAAATVAQSTIYKINLPTGTATSTTIFYIDEAGKSTDKADNALTQNSAEARYQVVVNLSALSLSNLSTGTVRVYWPAQLAKNPPDTPPASNLKSIDFFVSVDRN